MSAIAQHDDVYTKLDFRLDDGIGRRAAIGLVVLATDHTIEHEWRGLLRQDGVAFYESRVYNSADITPERLAEMEDRIAPAVALIRPAERIDVVAFGCTSASMVIGEEKVFARIREARADAACTTPITAALAALSRTRRPTYGPAYSLCAFDQRIHARLYRVAWARHHAHGVVRACER
ncbi:hypothetical protein OKW46_000521 [Paraburkholderia sp. WSM4179]|nr:hypothetical protein [Paraburkholderia sp. WSM4179]